MLRILMIPLFVVLCYLPIPNANIYAVVVFAVASFTDFLDGNIARKYNLVTTFGKFMDPLADKLLVTAALLMAIEGIGSGDALLPAFVPIIILSREFMVTGIRTLAVGEGKIIAASPLGKAKTISQMILIIVLFIVNKGYSELFVELSLVNVVVIVLIALATLLTIISGADYFFKNKHIIFSSK
jgi:CDP-diacylglycerol--glycerol-3-phosphate 3-phosphatidyltransferase